MSKPNLVVIVEGRTESGALSDLLSDHLRGYGVSAIFPLIAARGGQGGGHKPFKALVQDIFATAKGSPGVYISTCFDYYGLNPRWPKVMAIKTEPIDAYSKAAKIENAIQEEVSAEIDADILWRGHFYPYIQLHEFETLLFAAPEILGRELQPRNAGDDLKTYFSEIVRQHQSKCESINDRVETAPSKRIEAIAQYKKGKTGQARTILPIIGLERIRQACPRFDEWIKKLERLKSDA